MTSSWMLVAGALFAGMGVFVKLGAAYFSVAELVFYRAVIGLLMIGAVVAARRQSVSSPHWKTHTVRGTVGFISLLAYFYAVTQMPLAMAMTLSYTAPLFLAVMTTLILGEKFPVALIFAVVLGFSGTALIFQPSISGGYFIPALFAVCSGFFAALAYLNVRKLGSLGEPDWRIVFYFSLIASLGASAWQATFAAFHPITLQSGGILLGMGFCATLAQLAMTRAYSTGNTMVAGALSYSTVVYASVLGIAVWGDWLPWASWLGIAVIIAGGVIATRVETREHGKVVIEE
jgi:drug/metabolite transporter (DMT)-like permease